MTAALPITNVELFIFFSMDYIYHSSMLQYKYQLPPWASLPRTTNFPLFQNQIHMDHILIQAVRGHLQEAGT